MRGERATKPKATVLRSVGDPSQHEPMPPLLPNREFDNLPRRLTSFIGREAEVSELQQLLGDTRMLSLTGAGGAGKSRLALEVATRATDWFENGVCWVDIAPLDAPGLVADTLATALSVPEVVFLTRTQSLERFLRDMTLLIVLDNCEHLISACAELAMHILATCPGVRIVATSREPLGIEGETIRPVPPLEVPLETGSQTATAIASSEAVQLFVDRATAQHRAFGLTDANAGAIAEICRGLDGIPLAIELAAARVRMLSPQQISAGLEDRFALLAKGTRTAVSHHRSLEASMDWSYDLLSEPARRLLRRLSVFAGSFSLEAAERVATGDGIDRSSALELLSELVDKSLVDVVTGVESSRYRLLETVRRYAAEKLVASGEESAVKDRHLDFYVQLAERAEPQLEGHGYAEWRSRLEHELNSLRAAMEWATARERADLALRIAALLWGFWNLTGQLREPLSRIAALVETPDLDESLRGKSVVAAAYISAWLGDIPSGSTFASQSLEIGLRTGDERTVARSLIIVGFMRSFADAESGIATWKEAAEVARKAGDPFALGETLALLGFGETVSGNLNRGRSLLEEALSVGRDAGNIFVLSRTLCFLGWAVLYQGSIDEAEAFFTECIDLGRVGGDWSWILARAFLGLAASWRGQHGRAGGLLGEAERLVADSGNPYATAWIHMVSARSAAAGGNLLAADSHADEAIAFFRPMGMKALLAWCLSVRAEVAAARADQASAHAYWEEALAHAREQGSRMAIVRSLQGMARSARVAGDLHDSLALQHEALGMIAVAGHTVVTADALEELAGILADGQDFREAARLFGAAQALRDRIGYVRATLQRDGYEADVALVRQALGPGEFASAWDQGRAMDADEAVAYAARGRGRRLRRRAGQV